MCLVAIIALNLVYDACQVTAECGADIFARNANFESKRAHKVQQARKQKAAEEEVPTKSVSASRQRRFLERNSDFIRSKAQKVRSYHALALTASGLAPFANAQH
eukprot:SAG11_NODE_1396_length_5036_cov_2.382824_5_plen_104_part_00